MVVSFRAMRPTLHYSQLKERQGIMKFSPRKKAKMRKARFKRIKKNCKNMLGYHIDYDTDCRVIDQTIIKDVMYLLTCDAFNNFAIYKVVNPCDMVRVSGKKVLRFQGKIRNHMCWKYHSEITLSENGEIESVREGSFTRKNTPKKDIYIFIML